MIGRRRRAQAGDAPAPRAVAVSVAAHPRARAAVRRAKGVGGLGGFALAGLLSLKAGVPAAEAGERALGAGVAGYLLAWGVSVTIWRQLVIAELELATERLRARRDAEAIGGGSAPGPLQGS